MVCTICINRLCSNPDLIYCSAYTHNMLNRKTKNTSTFLTGKGLTRDNLPTQFLVTNHCIEITDIGLNSDQHNNQQNHIKGYPYKIGYIITLFDYLLKYVLKSSVL